jgi:hypothetical protein
MAGQRYLSETNRDRGDSTCVDLGMPLARLMQDRVYLASDRDPVASPREAAMHPALVIPTSATVINKLQHSCQAVVFLVLALVASQGTAFGSPQATGGGLQAAQSFAVGTSPQYVVVGDFNGDGKPDLVTANSGSNNVSVLLGNGNGTFQSAVNYGAGSSPSSIAVGDFNGDGKLDLVVGNSTGVAVLLGNGDGTFQTAMSYGAAIGQVAIGDFNGDGKLDIISSGGTVLLGNGNGTFQALATMFSPVGTAIAVGDFNQDGKLDFALGNTTCAPQCCAPQCGVTILIGKGDGTFQTGNTYNPVGFPVSSVAVADFNGDGHLDLAVASPGSGFVVVPDTRSSILFGNGDGTFGASVGLEDGIWAFGPTALIVGDFKGDGRPDVALARQNTGVLVSIQNADGTFQSQVDYGVPSLGVAVGDFNMDGKLDLVAVSSFSNSVSLMLGNGDGTFQAQVSYPATPPGSPPTIIAIGDFNGDGNRDLEVGTSNTDFENTQSLRNLLGNGDGTFRPGPYQSFGQEEPSALAVGDFNGDGKQDLAEGTVPCGGSTGILVRLGNGDGTFQSPVSNSSDALSLAVADLNGDGKLDIVSAGCSSTDSVLLGNGDGTFQPPASLGIIGNFRVGDFNGDGIADLAVSSGSNSISILLGKGDGTFQGAVNYGVGKNPGAITAGDFNGDSKLDVAVATQDGIDLLLGNGDGTFQNAVIVGPPCGGIDVVDFNGDGKLDLVCGSGILYGNGDGTFQALVQYDFLNGFWQVGDFNNDGAPDLVVTGFPDSVVTVFLNRGGSSVNVSSSANPSSFNQSVTFTANVAASLKGLPTPTGTVSFKDFSTTLGTASVESGVASITVSNLSVGTHSISMVYSGDSNFNPHTAPPITQRVTQAGTSTSLVSSANPSLPGQAVTFTATVSPLTSGIPTGLVTFKDGATTLGTVSLNGSGQAKLTTSTLKAGSHSISASYNGDFNFTGSISQVLTQIVEKAATTTVVASSANPITIGQSVTFTATVSSSAGAPPNGEFVTFKNGAATLGAGTLSGGSATFTTSSLTAGSDSIRATYPGDATFLTSTSATLTETVNKYATTSAVTSSANPSSFGQSVTFTASVTSASGGTPGGTVTFKNGNATLGTQNLSGGAASLATSGLTVGTHSITVVYSGDASHASSTSPALSQVVNKAATSLSLTSSQNPSTVGQSVTFTATVTPSTFGVPTGSVTFKSGTKPLGTVQLVNGSASLSTTLLAKGSDTITATYNGSGNFTGSSNILIQVVN